MWENHWLGARVGSSFQNLVAPTQNLGASGDRAPVRQQPCRMSVVSPRSRFAYKSIRLHDLRCFSYTEVDTPTTKYRRSKLAEWISCSSDYNFNFLIKFVRLSVCKTTNLWKFVNRLCRECVTIEKIYFVTPCSHSRGTTELSCARH